MFIHHEPEKPRGRPTLTRVPGKADKAILWLSVTVTGDLGSHWRIVIAVISEEYFGNTVKNVLQQLWAKCKGGWPKKRQQNLRKKQQVMAPGVKEKDTKAKAITI